VTLVDANILIDLFTNDPQWIDWSEARLIEQAEAGPVGLNPIIYAEASVAFTSSSAFEAALKPLELNRWALPYEAGFRAGKAFLQYRRDGGERRSPLPDFYIGAHAEWSGLKVLSRDPRRFQRYFPSVGLICPGFGKG